MLRFLGQFQADFQLKSGWIRPLLVGGHAPFSPLDCFRTILVCVDDAFTQQKYVENRELPKSTQKVLKTKSVENQGFMLS